MGTSFSVRFVCKADSETQNHRAYVRSGLSLLRKSGQFVDPHL
jgi:hypothetical protein